MRSRQFRARLGLIDVVMLAGIAAMAVLLVLKHFTAVDPAAALALAGLAAVVTFHTMSATPATGESEAEPDRDAPNGQPTCATTPPSTNAGRR